MRDIVGGRNKRTSGWIGWEGVSVKKESCFTFYLHLGKPCTNSQVGLSSPENMFPPLPKKGWTG